MSDCCQSKDVFNKCMGPPGLYSQICEGKPKPKPDPDHPHPCFQGGKFWCDSAENFAKCFPRMKNNYALACGAIGKDPCAQGPAFSCASYHNFKQCFPGAKHADYDQRCQPAPPTLSGVCGKGGYFPGYGGAIPMYGQDAPGPRPRPMPMPVDHSHSHDHAYYTPSNHGYGSSYANMM